MKITIGAVVPARSSLQYKTGTWRDRRPVLNVKICQDCGRCEDVCPDNAVHLVADDYVIDYEFCKGCGLCAYECPANAICMVEQEK